MSTTGAPIPQNTDATGDGTITQCVVVSDALRLDTPRGREIAWRMLPYHTRLRYGGGYAMIKSWDIGNGQVAVKFRLYPSATTGGGYGETKPLTF